MNKRWLQRCIFLILLITWGFIITSFSSQTGEESAGLSEKIAKVVVGVLYSDYDELPLVEKESIFDTWHLLVRKLAHFTEYAIFAMLMCGFLISFERLRLGNAKFGGTFVLIAVLFSAVFAAFDEYHQSFVEGRGPSVIDVMIDTGGAVLGAGLVLAFCVIRRKRRRDGGCQEDTQGRKQE